MQATQGGRHNIRTTARQLIQEEGLLFVGCTSSAPLFSHDHHSNACRKGMLARVLHVAPSSALMIVSYEAVKRFSYRRDIPQ